MHSSSILALAASLFMSTASAQSAGYLSTCTNTQLGESGGYYYLDATCTYNDGDYHNTNIQLGSCFANNGGNIVFQINGNFQESCSGCYYGVTDGAGDLICLCNKTGGGQHTNVINLNDFIGNGNGNLVC